MIVERENNEQQSKISIALLIDGDNTVPKLIADYITETEKFGKVTIRRIYGDWTTPEMKGWKGNLKNTLTLLILICVSK